MSEKVTSKLSNKLTTLSKYITYLLLIAFILSVYRNIGKINEINRKIDEKEEKVNKLEDENRDLEKRLAEVATDDYIEKQIRDKLGLAKAGELVLVLPPPEELRKFAPKIEEEPDSLPDPIWKKWAKLFGI